MSKKKNVALLSGFGNAEIIEKKEEKVDKKLILSHYDFSYCEDENIKEYLEKQATKLHTTVSKGHTEIGKILTETQEELVGDNQYNGYFEKWYTSQGFNKKGVYRYINRYKLICSCQNDTSKNYIESLPITLTYEISNPNCPGDLKKAVLNGDIKTLKEFKEFKQLEMNDDQHKSKMIDVTPINYKYIQSKSKSVVKIFKEAQAKIDENLSEDKLELFNKNLEKIEKDIEKLFDIFK